MSIIAMSCCGKMLHRQCMIRQVENFGRCVYCHTPTTLDGLLKCKEYASILGGPVRATSDPKIKSASNSTVIDESETILNNMASRDIAIANKRKHQAQSHERMKRWRQDNIEKMCVSVGAVVTVQVDSRDVSHPQGLIGVVVAVKITGGILVVCASGLLSSTNSKKEYWVPVDKYKVVARDHEECVLPHDLLTLRKLVLEGRFEMNTHGRITIQKAHQHVVGASSPCTKRKCGCKLGRCQKGKCGCSKVPGLSCHSGCSCNGNCSLFQNISDDDSNANGRK